jgi:hypothetical protein
MLKKSLDSDSRKNWAGSIRNQDIFGDSRVFDIFTGSSNEAEWIEAEPKSGSFGAGLLMVVCGERS